MQVRKQQLEPDREQRTGSKLGKRRTSRLYIVNLLIYFYAEYIMRNAGLDESQAGIKIAERNIIYADDSTLMTESEEELKSLLMKVKEESGKAGLKLNLQKPKILASGPIISWQIDGERVKTNKFIFLGSNNTVDGDCSHDIKDACSLEEKSWPT